jgi:ribosomal protein S19E (S16A)
MKTDTAGRSTQQLATLESQGEPMMIARTGPISVRQRAGLQINHNVTAVRATSVRRKITVNHNVTVVRVAGVNRKITVNHNVTVVRAAGVKHGIHINHNVTVVRASQAK